ncbi:hypothetical protein FJZ36_03470 [Candidatus Poribacteria bacterium]|nr:hypothetical protein [Candidatus Poribacteria bacterium]
MADPSTGDAGRAPDLSARHVPLPTPSAFSLLPFEEQALYLCRVAHLAPSTHNTQPWRFRIDPRRASIELYLDRVAVLPESDPKGRQATISVGCALESLVVAAECYGLASGVSLCQPDRDTIRPLEDDQPDPLVHLATVQVQRAPELQPLGADDPRIRAMISRRIVRAEMDASTPVPPSLVQALTSRSLDGFAHIHALSSSSVAKRLLAELQGQADAFVINSSTFRQELASWLLPNDTHLDVGMPGIGFGLNDDEARRIHDGLAGRIPLRPEDGLKFSLAGKRGIDSSPLVLLVVVPRDEVVEWLKAGRAMQCALLDLEREGFHAAIHAAVAEVPLIRSMFRWAGADGALVCVVRAGRARNSEHARRPYSPRQPIDRVMLDDLSQE